MTKQKPEAKRKKREKYPPAPVLRPKTDADGRVTSGTYSLDELLRGKLDGRLAIVKERDRLEAQIIDYCGGPDNLPALLIILIKKIVHKTLVTEQREKIALMSDGVELDKHYITTANSLRLDILALQKLLSEMDSGKAYDLKNYITTVGKEKK